jgi:hypothetical protein
MVEEMHHSDTGVCHRRKGGIFMVGSLSFSFALEEAANDQFERGQ